jgi:acetyl esterase/lipase
MANSPQLMEVISHLRQLAIEAQADPQDIARRRNILDRYFAIQPEVMEASIRPEKTQVAGRDAYWLVPAGHDGQRRLLYLHGGSWSSGSIKGWQAYVGRLAQACDCAVLFIDYSLMPEAPFPAGLNDCINAYLWLRENSSSQKSASDQIFIAGDSAGGNLAIASLLALKQKGLPQPDKALAISPCLDFTASGDSMESKQALDPIIRAQVIPLLGQLYMSQSEHEPTHPLASPLFAEARDLAGLAPIMLQTGEAEVLLSDSERFAEKARQAGVEVCLDTWPNMPHVFQGFAPLLPEASAALEKIAQFFRATR